MATGDFGLRPIKAVGGRRYTGGRTAYAVSNAYGTALFAGDPVKVSAGYIVKMANGERAQGVFMGCSYNDANGNPVLSEYLPASTSSTAIPPIDSINGALNPVAYVADDPNLIMLIRADSSVSQGHMGLNFVVSLGTGSTLTKKSGANLKVASAQTSGITGSADDVTMVKLLGVYNTPNNSIGSANPLLEVIWVAHEFNNAG